jgi:heptosyltransferase-2/heptosyltransferase-3
MSKRQRWNPVRGTGNRIYDRRERFLLGALDLPGRVVGGVLGALGMRRPKTPLPAEAVREVLVLRLDRIGDLLMSLPALADLRAALPQARIRLAVGRWSQELAKSAPVDEVLVWSAPWVGRSSEGSESFGELRRKARGLRAAGLDLALDLQGDVRASVLLWMSGARSRVGYANTGGAYLLTQVVPLDETVSWVEQNRRAVAVATAKPVGAARPDPLTEADRAFAARLVQTLGLEAKRPLVGIHPSGGRLVKQWEVARWHEVASRLQRDFQATVLITGSEADKPLGAALGAGLPGRPLDLTGKLTVRETLAVISALDLFLSPDTGPMHMACAVGTPSVAVFGPSDPVRYFSGEHARPESRHRVVRTELWCSPCNLIRKPPDECSGPEPPECLRLVEVEDVYREAVRLLKIGRAGFAS